MYSHLDLQDYNFRILTGSTADLIMGTVCATTSPSSPPFSTRMMHDHSDHTGHVDHVDHMDHANHMNHQDHTSTTPRISRLNSVASKMSAEAVFMMTLLTRMLEALV